MTDSRDKGYRAEDAVKKELIRLTGLAFQRVPGSGALAAVHGLKGDLYIPNEKNVYAIEVKHFATDKMTSKILTDKNPQLMQWWEQAVRQGEQTCKKPLLIFKHDRSKMFVGFEKEPTCDYDYFLLSIDEHSIYIALLTDWIKYENPQFI
jgi:Holliday junction resolvase